MNLQASFCFKQRLSPTQQNLTRYLKERGWQARRFSWQADFNDENLEFDILAAEQLEFKHRLADLIADCSPELMPVSYCINDQTWPLVISEIADRFYKQNGFYVDKTTQLSWILKPALLNNGQNIHIFSTLSQIEAHFLSPKRMGGEQVLQRYLQDPDLLRGQHKYSIRLFVVLSNYGGSYLYPQGYFNVALHPYSRTDFSDLRSHLTNEHLDDNQPSVVQIPSTRFAFFASIYPQIKANLVTIIAGLKARHPQAFICSKKARLAIFGFDFMLDKDKRLWLLEANHGPCFPVSDSHPLHSPLYFDFWQAFIDSFVQPIAEGSTIPPQKSLFESLG